MSGAQTSSFYPVNQMLQDNAAQITNQYNTQNNPLLLQEHQQLIGNADTAYAARASSALLQLPTEEARAAMYPQVVAEGQQRGFLKNAPSTYPGEGALRRIQSMGLTLPEQYQYGVITAPGLQGQIDAILGKGATGTGTGTTSVGVPGAPVQGARGPGSMTRGEAEGGPPAAGSPGAAVAQRTHDFWISKGYTEEQVAGIMAGGPGSESDFTPSVYGDNRTSYGLYQHHGPRLAAMQQHFGLTGGQMPSEQQQNEYAAWEISPQGPLAKVGVALAAAKTPAEAATIWTRDFGVPGDKTEIDRRARGAGRYVGLYGSPQGGTQTAAAAPGVQVGGAPPAPPGGPPGAAATAYPATGGGVGSVISGRPAPTTAEGFATPERYAAPGVTPPASPVAAIQSGMQLAQATPVPPGTVQTAGLGAGSPGAAVSSVEVPPQAGWGTGTPGAQGYGGGTFAQAAAPPAAPPPARPNQALPGQPNGAPAPAAQAQPPAAQPGSRANLPSAASLPSGVNSQQYQQAVQLQRQALALDALVDPTGRAKLLAAGLRQQAQLLLQTDSVVQTQEGQFHPLTGKIDETAKPLPHWVVDPNAGGPGIPGAVDTTGTNKPEINPARRITTRADGSIVNDLGNVIAPALTGATPPLGSFEVQKHDYESDAKMLPEIAQAGQQAQSSQIKLQAMLDLIPKISTGAGGMTRMQLANLAETAGFPGIAQTLIAHNSEGDTAAAQEFSKLTLAQAGAAERGDLGSRGSLGAIRLYQQANPNLDLRPGANKAIIGMQLIAAQADTDYSQAALSYANKRANDFRSGTAPYQPLANFDLQWQQQRNPQVYAAAMGALNGQKNWWQGLSDEGPNSEYKRALEIVSRASPSAVVTDKSGNRISMQPNTRTQPKPPPGFTVVQ